MNKRTFGIVAKSFLVGLAASLIVSATLSGCNLRKYNGAHIIAGDISGDVEITDYESISLQSERLYLKDGGSITLGKGMYILFIDTCPICGTKGERSEE